MLLLESENLLINKEVEYMNLATTAVIVSLLVGMSIFIFAIDKYQENKNKKNNPSNGFEIPVLSGNSTKSEPKNQFFVPSKCGSKESCGDCKGKD